MPVKHIFVSGIGDGADPNLVRASNWNADHVVDSLAMAQGSLTASSPFLDHSATWNSAGVQFIGFRSNIVNTASLDTSKHFTFQVGGVDRFYADLDDAQGGHNLNIASPTGSARIALGEWLSTGVVWRFYGDNTLQFWTWQFDPGASTTNVNAHRIGLIRVGVSAELGGSNSGSNISWVNSPRRVCLGNVGGQNCRTNGTGHVFMHNEQSGEPTEVVIQAGPTQGSSKLLRFHNSGGSAIGMFVDANGILNAASVLNGAGALTLPSSSDTLVGRATSDTLTNKTLTTPVLGAFTVATLPAAGTINRLAIVTDGNGFSCTSGGGSTVVFCRDTGSAWAPLGDGNTGGGGGAFTSLTDVPTSYTGHAQKFVKVNVGESGLEFVASSAAAHDLLSSTHSDTAAAAVQRGDLIVGNSTPAWARLAKGAADTFLSSDGTDPSWVSAAAARARLGVMPLPRLRRFTYINVLVGTGLSKIGDDATNGGTTLTAIGPDADVGKGVNYPSTTATGDNFGAQGELHYRVGRNVHGTWRVHIPTQTSIRVWIGFSSDTLANMAASDSPTAHIAAFRFSTDAGDTNYQACTNSNAAGVTCQDTGVAPSATVGQDLEVEFRDGTPDVVFRINGAVVHTATTDLPASGNNIRYVFGGETRTTAARNLHWQMTHILSDR